MSEAIIGYGKVGGAYHKVFPDAVVYDPYRAEFEATKEDVNACDVALVCVPTDLNHKRELDMTIVEEVVDWIECPLIVIKSALQPETTDRLVEKTGKKIATSVEFVGEGSYYVPPWKYPDTQNPLLHDFLIVGGSDEATEAAAEWIWARMSPDIRIHKITALEAEIAKLVENTYGAYKVTWANAIKSLTDKTDQSFIRVHQAWTQDGRVDAMHTRVTSDNRGWASKCWDKDTIALETYARKRGVHDLATLIGTIVNINQVHLGLNGDSN